ncbi:MAG: hypothetical protein RMI50_01815 [Aquificaceae bacterium]|nr:hypothetical protein [Aquificaceae bacterium]
MRYKIVGSLLLTVNLVYGSAWVQQKGKFFISPSFYYYNASNYYDKKGNKKPIGCDFEKREFQLYGEYGLTSKETLTFKVPYQSLKCVNSTEGFSDIEIGVIRNLRRDANSSLSLYGNLIVPTGYSIKENPRLGYGRFGIEGGLLYGLSDRWGYLDSGLLYRYYFGYPSSQLRPYVSIGYNITKEVQLYMSLDAQIGLGDGNKKVVGNNIFLEPDYKLVQIYVGPRLMLKGFSLGAGYQRLIWGRNTGDGQGFYVNGWFSF